MQTPRIGKELFTLLDGKVLEDKQHEAMMLLTVTEDQWPHIAMISVGEVVALDEGNLRLALWPGTTTTGNMIRTRKATLAVFTGGRRIMCGCRWNICLLCPKPSMYVSDLRLMFLQPEKIRPNMRIS